jgi:hypothetical protein
MGHALHSLYNSKHQLAKRALAGNVGGQARVQTVMTPWWLLDGLIKAAGPIQLDPATEPYNPTRAKMFCTKKTDGRKCKWHKYAPNHFYVNPEFADLEEWMRKSWDEFVAGARGYMLAPFRPQRTWFCELTRGFPVLSLRPFPFVGQKQSFPAPLCLIVYGAPMPELYMPRKRGEPTNMITRVWG